MNSRISSLTSSAVAALLALSLSADDWDDALDDVGKKESSAQALETEVARIRAEKGERFQFLPPPEGARLFTAKDFAQPASSNWKEKDGSFSSRGGRKGNLSLRYRPSKKGIQYVWVYLLDWKRQGKDKGSGELDVIATQGGSAAGTMKLLRSMSPLSTAAGVKKYGVQERPWPSYVWQDGFFRATSTDEVKLELSVKEGAYDVKAVVVTDDPTYEPRLADFFPMWLKVKAAKAQKAPAKCSLYMRHGIDKSWFYKFPEPLKPGADTGWFYCSRFLPYGVRTIQVTLDDGSKPAGDAEFEVFVSRTGRDDDILFSCRQSGGGNCKSIRFEQMILRPASDRIAVDDDLSSSAKSLARARALTAQKGAAPQAFEFQMNFGLSEKNGETFRNEDAARRAIGCRQIEGAPSPLGYYQTSYDKCICTPNRERIAKAAPQLADVKGPAVSWFMDEPGGAVTPGCPNCPKHFAAFLKEHGVKPAELGYRSAADVAPVFSQDASAQEKELPLRTAVLKENIALEDESDVTLEEKTAARLDPKKAVERYYWSRRYETTALRRFYAFATAEVEKHNPTIRTTATLSPDYIDKCNSVAHRVDYFDLFENGGLTFAQTEDWCNVADDYQVVGYLTDFFRAAARRRDLPVSIYDIMPMRDARTIATKAFAEVAHGARRINFWGYGPAYMVAEYSASDTPGLQAAIKSVTWPVGACEKTILGGARAPGDVAYLYSITTDILAGVPAADSTDVRAASSGNASCGMERMWVDILLTQSGYSTDILDENGVKDFLKGYRAAWTAEFNLRKDALAPLVGWVKGGGTLVLGPGALARDEYNRPLGFDEAVGLTREPFAYHLVKTPEKVGDTIAAKGLAKITSGKPVAAFASGRPAAYEQAVGKGRVIALAFSPGMSYWWNGKSNKGVYAPDLRNLVTGLFAKVPRTVWADDSRVEARLYRGKGEDVIVVANWAKEDLAKVTLTVPSGYRSAKSFNSTSSLSGDKLTLSMLPAGDCVVLVK